MYVQAYMYTNRENTTYQNSIEDTVTSTRGALSGSISPITRYNILNNSLGKSIQFDVFIYIRNQGPRVDGV